MTDLDLSVEFDDPFGSYDYVSEYLEFLQYCSFESFMDQLKYDIWEQNTYGHIWEEADLLAEKEWSEEELNTPVNEW